MTVLTFMGQCWISAASPAVHHGHYYFIYTWAKIQPDYVQAHCFMYVLKGIMVLCLHTVWEPKRPLSQLKSGQAAVSAQV